jgi:hypothetical protein
MGQDAEGLAGDMPSEEARDLLLEVSLLLRQAAGVEARVSPSFRWDPLPPGGMDAAIVASSVWVLRERCRTLSATTASGDLRDVLEGCRRLVEGASSAARSRWDDERRRGRDQLATPPGTERFDEGRVHGSSGSAPMEIRWTALACSQPMETVVAFYREQLGPHEPSAGLEYTWRLEGAQPVVSVQPVSTGGPWTRPPPVGTQTVIVFSISSSHAAPGTPARPGERPRGGLLRRLRGRRTPPA